MIPYLLLLFFPLLGCFIEIRNNDLHLRISWHIQKRNLALPIFFLLLFLLLAFRHESIGRDLLNYKNFFQNYSSQPFYSLLLSSEPLYAILNWCIGHLSLNYQFYLAIVAAICVFPIAALYCEDRKCSYLKLIIFLILPVFIMMFSGLRQAIAMSIGLIAYRYVRKRRLIPFLLLVFIALGFHKSSFMLLPMYWIYNMRFKRKHLYFILPGMAVLYIFNGPIFNFLLKIIPEYSNKYDASAGVTGAVNMLILFFLFAVFSYIVSDETKMDEEAYGLRNFLLVCFGLQCFAPVHNLAMRLNYYYILFIPLAVARVFATTRPQYRQIAKLAHIAMCAFFTAYFLYTSYVSCITGISDLDTFPYVPFWRG